VKRLQMPNPPTWAWTLPPLAIIGVVGGKFAVDAIRKRRKERTPVTAGLRHSVGGRLNRWRNLRG
jgi:hypothetical protein